MKPHQLLSMLIVTSALTICQGALAADQPLNPGQVSQVKDVVHDYLVTNPQVLVEASQSLQKQEMEKAAKKAKDGIAQNANSIFEDAASPIGGNAKGNVTLVEFFDYQCPHCKDMKATIDNLVAGEPDLRVVYKELPIFGQTSRDASAAALASIKQGADKYAKLHEALLGAENPLNKEKVLQIAKANGLDADKLAKDMSDAGVQKQIDDNFKLAQALNLMGTPTFIISKWQVGAKNNDAKNAAFIPGMPSANELKTRIAAVKAAK